MNFVVLAVFLLFAIRRLLTYLHIYQQEEYDSVRFIRWLIGRRSFDTRATLGIFVIGVVQIYGAFPGFLAGILAVLILIVTCLVEKDPRYAGKKPLVMTARAKRVYFSALVFVLAVGLAICLSRAPVIVWILAIQIVPFALTAGNLVLAPYENTTQKRFWSEAHNKLLSLKPVTIGITGSYGKTSTKHLLGHILETQAPTLITPGSVNTPMGIARIVRERLAAHHRFFVCEMGAYGPGSIERLCRLAPPSIGVITAIGMAHYERFKSLETVAQTKFELAQAVAARNGSVVIAEQVLEFSPARSFFTGYREKTLVVGSGADCAMRITSKEQTDSGIEANVDWKGASYTLRAPLYGEHHITNMVLAFATACALGVAPEDAIIALASVPQISHRLEVKRGPNGARMIDDAYNSNPAGFASALRLLDALNRNGGRRVLVTPGMVELGPAHHEEHRKLGLLAGNFADVLLPVAPERIQALTTAYASSNPNGTIVSCPDFATADAWLRANLGPSDTVLLENDLPDLYERRLKL